MRKQLIKCRINGRDTETVVDIRASLTDLLRGEYRLTSVKKGCEVGECGACNVIINGECFNSCIYLAIWADGKEITTTEGLLSADGELSEIQQAFIDEGAVQCGFCTPGFLLSAAEIVRSGKDDPARAGYPAGAGYSDEDLRTLLSGHLCRCTGYENIFRAVRSVCSRRSVAADAALRAKQPMADSST